MVSPLLKPTKKIKKKKTKPKNYEKMADRELQELGRKMYKYCEICGEEQQVLHHFIKKSQSTALRYCWENCIPLCNRCHCSIHQGKSDLITGKIVAQRGSNWLYELETKKKEGLGKNYNRLWFKEQYEILNNANGD